MDGSVIPSHPAIFSLMVGKFVRTGLSDIRSCLVPDAHGFSRNVSTRARKVGQMHPDDQLQSTAGRVRAVRFAFDLIQLGGEDQRARPLLERKALLAKLLARANEASLQ